MTRLAARALRLGTRRSRLAIAQSRAIADALAVTGYPVTLVPTVTEGDRTPGRIADAGGTGLFVSALRERLLAGEVDLAVHSLKDLPTGHPDGLALAAVPARVDPRDALVDRHRRRLSELPPGTTVGTASPRRVAQLRALGVGLDVVPLRGNVDSRLGTVEAGRVAAVVVARAGLLRLGRDGSASEALDPMLMMPAPGQGALAVECRADDDRTRTVLEALDDPPTRLAVTAERALLTALEAGCTAPVGALAEVAEGDSGPELYLRALVADVAGEHVIRLSATGAATDPAATGQRLAAALLDAGAADLIGESP